MYDGERQHSREERGQGEALAPHANQVKLSQTNGMIARGLQASETRSIGITRWRVNDSIICSSWPSVSVANDT